MDSLRCQISYELNNSCHTPLLMFCRGHLIGVASRHWLLDGALPLAAAGYVPALVQSLVTRGSVGKEQDLHGHGGAGAGPLPLARAVYVG